ncbi:DUF2207 domain-containing protein, partial [Candidatus Saccharibacteria bacterium]|nr:DUF2207 domain-containing protein [Candidatus Saccharibacteria bacterium]
MSVDDFHFKDFTADYYLSKDAEGISHLKVEESLTAVFPDFSQNKGICRKIPTTNQNGANNTLEKLTKDDIVVLRNGQPEPIWSIELGSDHYEVCTGTDDYVLGEQTYTFKYQFKKVITDFGDYQELYWDTNGNGWAQSFGKLTANLHFVGLVGEDYQDLSWCYVGAYGESGQERCEITKLEDGVSFATTTSLDSGENLTFDAQFNPGSFTVPPPIENYNLIWLSLGLTLLCILVLIFPFFKYKDSRPKIKYYKNLFTKPEFQPSKDYTLSEMSEIYLGSKRSAKVGILLDLIVRRKITIIDTKAVKSSDKWLIHVNSLDGVDEPSLILLKILNGGRGISPGSEFAVKRHPADSNLIQLEKKYEKSIVEDLKSAKLVESNYRYGNASRDISLKGAIISYFAMGIAMSVFIYSGVTLLYVFIDEIFNLGIGLGSPRRGIVYGYWLIFAMGIIFYTTGFVWAYLSAKNTKYGRLTQLGLEQSKYMEGLQLYIKMAEKER